MKCFLIPDSLFLRSNTDSCGSGLKRFNAFEIHGDCWELHGNCSLLWSSCWAEAVHPPPGIGVRPAATTQGPRASFIITSTWWSRDRTATGGYGAPVVVLGRAITPKCRAHCSSSSQQQAGGGEGRKENAHHCDAAKWLIPLQELPKPIVPSLDGAAYTSQSQGWSSQCGVDALCWVLRLVQPWERLDINCCKMKISDPTAQFCGTILVLWKSQGWNFRDRWTAVRPRARSHTAPVTTLLPSSIIQPWTTSGCVHENPACFWELTKNTLIKKKIKISNPEHFQSSHTLPQRRGCPVPGPAVESEAGLILPWEMLYHSIICLFNSRLPLNTQCT